MKNTRKAAAIWLAMSLAISTAFGNTAWGEIRPDTGNNRCVHVHTAECYKDADETATPSQIGKEPTECTHICSVESGCIRDTEKENNENADTLDTVASNTGKNDSKKEQAGEKAADRKDSSGNADENKNLNDVPAQNGAALSVGTPSNAKDTTTTGGTVTQVSQTKILSWSWFDPEENLLDGRLELTGITEEAQPSFTEITEYLPSAIIARVEKGKDGENVEDGEEKNLSITNWSCPEYVQDEEGRWPLEGTYEFKAELEEGYELAEGVDALAVEVSVAGDQAVMINNERVVMHLSFSATEDPKDLKFNGSTFSSYQNAVEGLASQNNISYQYLGNDNFKLILNNTTIYNIEITSGSWIIELHGNNELIGSGKGAAGIGLYISGGSATIIAADELASLTVNGYPKSQTNDGSSGIQVKTSLTIESGIINATLSKKDRHNDASGAIYVTRGGTLNIKGGSITATGHSRWALAALGTINMSDGVFNIVGDGKIAVDHEPSSNFTLSGGIINITSPTGHKGLSTKDNLLITGGRMNVNILEIVDDGTMTVEGGILETGGIKIGNNGKLINKGELIANGNFEGNGTIENTGTISGTGSVPDSAKQTPDTITGYSANISKEYSENMSINVPQCAQITKPAKAGELQYELVKYTGSESKGEGTIDGSTGLMTVKKAGVFKIKVKTLAGGLYKEGTPVTITVTVNKAAFPEYWNLTVEAAKGKYNGSQGYPAATITGKIGIPEDARYEYQLAATPNSNNLMEQWESTCPTIVNVADSNKYVFVRVLTDNYQPKIFVSNDKTEITKRNFNTEVGITIDPSTYNGENQNPKIKVVENWNGVSGNELKEGVDYTINYWSYWTGTEYTEVKELKNAGKYTVYLLGKGNYDNSQKTAAFTINKCKLKAQITGDSYDKVYDGTTDITEEQKLAIQLCDDNNGTPELQEVRADQVEWAYRSADVGEHDIDATIISLAGDQAKNYELTEQTVSQKGTIKSRDFASMTVSADPLTYNGTEQQPKINASVETGLENVSPDAVFTYSTDGVDYQSEIPGFTDAGTYLVYVKASMANFNDVVKTVTVTMKPKESSSGGNSGNNSGNNTSGGGGSNNGSSGSGSSNNGNSNGSNNGGSNGGSSSSDGDSYDYDDPNESSVKVTPNPSNKVTKDSQKGYRNVEQGIITGASNQTVNDGYSHWMKDAKGWLLRFSDGTWPMADRTGAYHWEKINGKWWAFDEMGYAKTGWLRDENYGGWFYMDPEHGMQTGWMLLNGAWYYFNPSSDGKRGIMYAGQRTPDGYYVDKNGVWDGRSKQ